MVFTPQDPYQQPTADVLHLEAQGAILDDSDNDGTEPIIDDGTSHGWG